MEFAQFLWGILILALLLLLIQLQNRVLKKKRLPPSPRKLPFLGNIHQLLGHDLPHVSLQRLSKEYGPLMLLQLGSIPTLVISSADVAREIFKAHDLVFSSRPQLYSGKRLSYGCNDMTFAPYGEYWREARKIAIIELLSLKRVQSFESVREEEVKFVIDFITRYSCDEPLRPVDLSELMLSLANNVICRVAFGRKYDGSEVSMRNGNGKAKFYEILRDTQRLLGEVNLADFYPWLGWLLNKVNGLDARLEKTFKELDELYDEVIEEHLHRASTTSNHEDLVDVLLRLQRDPTQTISLDNNQVKGILTDMFIAGSDTSSATLVWAMCELIRNPSTLKKAQDEVRQQVGKGKQKVEESDLPNLKYLKLVLKETLRLHPPVPLLVPRETTEPCVVRGYEIPAKTRVFINAKAISTDPNVWDDPDPNVFQPERFLNCEIDYRGQDFELIPFGVGRRSCPGLNFAILVVELALSNLLYRFDWSLPHGMTEDDIDMEEAIGLTTHKKTPLLLLASPRTT
uniref:Costunolide synthase n=1 Tax=Opuntia streptacantha TaxID=393608 RepID=A0A7C9AEB2_OPUST